VTGQRSRPSTGAASGLATTEARADRGAGEVARHFLETIGRTFDRRQKRAVPLNSKAGAVDAELNCIDFTKPVVAGPPPPAPATLGQWQPPQGDRGSYFAPPGTEPTHVGIGDEGRAWNLPGTPEVKKVETRHEIPPGQPYLRSTAAPAGDDWSIPGRLQPAKGGGTQYCIPNGCDPTDTSIVP
jgi:hypothetical protein